MTALWDSNIFLDVPLELIQKHEKKFNTHHSHANNHWFGGL